MMSHWVFSCNLCYFIILVQAMLEIQINWKSYQVSTFCCPIKKLCAYWIRLFSYRLTHVSMNLFFLIMTRMKNFTTTSQLPYLKLATNFSSDSSVMVPIPWNQGLVACCLLSWWIQLSDMSKNVKCWSQAQLEAGVLVGSSCNMIRHTIIIFQLHIHCAFHLVHNLSFLFPIFFQWQQ
jgi:hypothetical protein